LAHVRQLTRGELGQSTTFTPKSGGILLPLLLLLLRKLEEVGGSGLWDGLLSGGGIGDGLLGLRLGLGLLLSRGHLGLDMSGNSLIQL
jgi:hypothetical protein